MTGTVLQDIVARTRRELGDFGQPFRDTFVGQGTTGEFDLSETQISDASVVAVSGGVSTDLVAGTDYDLDTVNGTLILRGAYDPLQRDSTILITGTTYGMFTDEELQEYANDAFLQHTANRTAQRRYRDQSGFIRYAEHQMTMNDLPEIEVFLVSLLTTIEALWALTTDASTDVDIQTSDGTVVNRSTRYAQMRNQIDVLTDKYETLCGQLNVGLHRMEVLHLRRRSRTTNRLVPIFREREYDDYSLPTRILPPIDSHYEDESGIPSQTYGGYGW